MADFKEMYIELYREVNKAIVLLQEMQRRTEEMYIASDEANLIVLRGKEKKRGSKTHPRTW